MYMCISVDDVLVSLVRCGSGGGRGITGVAGFRRLLSEGLFGGCGSVGWVGLFGSSNASLSLSTVTVSVFPLTSTLKVLSPASMTLKWPS